jgi:hypothetical protein
MSKESERRPEDDNDIPPVPQIDYDDDDIDPDTPPVIDNDKDTPIDDQEQKPLVTQGDWEMHANDEGLPYFWNTKTGKSQWKAPPEWDWGKKFNERIEESVSTNESSPPQTSVLKEEGPASEGRKSTDGDAEKRPGFFSRLKEKITGFFSSLKEKITGFFSKSSSDSRGGSASSDSPQASNNKGGGTLNNQALGEDEFQLEHSRIYSQEYSLSRKESVSYSPEDSVVRSVFRESIIDDSLPNSIDDSLPNSIDDSLPNSADIFRRDLFIKPDSSSSLPTQEQPSIKSPSIKSPSIKSPPPEVGGPGNISNPSIHEPPTSIHLNRPDPESALVAKQIREVLAPGQSEIGQGPSSERGYSRPRANSQSEGKGMSRS